jgi:AhpD family alkylhydroperoxidase
MPATVLVFDPAMCCSTGVCGPSVDPQLARFSADLGWLKEQGVKVERFNLSQQLGAFVEHAPVKLALETKGEDALPLILVDGQVKSTGTYPSREQLAEWGGVVKPGPSIFTDAVSELVAIGAAIASNCEPCFKFHFDKARKLGVSREDMWSAVGVAQAVKDAPARAMLELAERHLRREVEASSSAPSAVAPEAAQEAAGCGGSKPSDTAAAEPKPKRCC